MLTARGDDYEVRRLNALRRYGLVDGPADESLTDLAAAAAAVCGTTTAAFSYVDATHSTFRHVFGDLVEMTVARDQVACPIVLDAHGDVVESMVMQSDPRFLHLPTVQSSPFQFYAGTALQTGDGLALGTLCVVDPEPQRLSAAQRGALRGLARVAMALTHQRWLTDRLLDVSGDLERAADTDPLTRLHNRRGLTSAMAAAQAGTSIAILDLDHFKQINDRLGHEAGDLVLVAFGKHLTGHVREGDVVARWGGEEFVLILPATPLVDALAVVDRLRGTWDETGATTVSAGVVEIASGEGVECALGRADAALYEAKRGGRNRVVTA